MDTDSRTPLPVQQKRSTRWRKIAGSTCIVLGLPGIVLPIIPGIPLIIAGFALLATEGRRGRSTAADPAGRPAASDSEPKPHEPVDVRSDKRSYMRRRT